MYKRATYHGIPCYFNLKTDEIQGRNLIYDLLVRLNIWLDIHVFEVEFFQIWIEEDSDDFYLN